MTIECRCSTIGATGETLLGVNSSLMLFKEVCTMNMKDAFRFQNKLKNLMCEATSILQDRRNIVKVKTTHLRSKVMSDALDAVVEETAPSEYAGHANEVAAFIMLLMEEREKLSKAIHAAKSGLDLDDRTWKIYTEDIPTFPQYISEEADVKNAYITQGCVVEGEVKNSVLFTSAKVGAGAKVYDSVLMPGAVVEPGAVLNRVIVADNVKIGSQAVIGSADSEHIELVSKNVKGVE